MNSSAKYRMIALVVTALLFAAMIAWLLLTRLSYDAMFASRQHELSADSAALLLADEYVEVEMIPPIEQGGGPSEDDGASAPPAVSHDLVDAGRPAEAAPEITSSTQPSPVNVKPAEDKKPTGPSKSELEKEKEKARQQADASEQIHGKVVFGKTPGATGTGDGTTGEGSGSGDKSSYVGTGSGTVGGRGISVATKIVSHKPGNVAVRIRVSSEGKVLSADIIPGKSTVADPSVREKCRVAALNARIGKGTTEKEEFGTITFIFK